MRIAIDIDGVLAEIMEHFLDFLSRETGVRLNRGDVDVYFDWFHKIGIDKERFKNLIQAFYLSEEFKKATPFDSESMIPLSQMAKEHTLMVVTSRPESTKEITEGFLDKFYPELFENVYYIGTSYEGDGIAAKSKAEMLSKLKADIAVDDDPGLAGIGECRLLLVDQPYNQDVEDNVCA